MPDAPQSKPPRKLTDEELSLAEEVAVRTVEEVTGRHRLTEAQRAALQDAPDDRVATEPRRIEDIGKSRVPIGWLGAVVGILVGAAGGIFAGGAAWSASKDSVVQAKADAAAASAKASEVAKQGEAIPPLVQRVDAGERQGADHEARLRILETAVTADHSANVEAHEAIRKQQASMDRKLDRLLDRVK